MPIASALPSFEHEEQYWNQGITMIAGIDEVGMGCLAGPVVAAAVIWRPDTEIAAVIRDSKQLSEKQRANAEVFIKEHAIVWAVGEASVAEIKGLNIRKASHVAMHRAVAGLKIQPEILLIDGNPAQPHPAIPAVNIIKGDQLSFSIAAASILAKVHRDRFMQQLDTHFPAYGFAGHKGYGAPLHLAALKEHGPTVHHRASYAPVAALLTSPGLRPPSP
jgi:ribonuclease HII